MKIYDDLSNKLVKCYFRGHLNFCLEPHEVEMMTLEWQQQFLDLTVNSPLLKRWPLSIKFTQLFFKLILKYLANMEVHDGMYINLCQTMDSCSDNNFTYRHYIMDKDLTKAITIKETNKIVMDGTTGMRTWEAALVLADWAISNKNKFVGKKILELGSGIGFTGVAIAKHCAPKSMYLTDCHPGVLKTLCDNIKLNFPQMQVNDEEAMFMRNNKKIGVMALDWDAIENISSNIVPDIIIGADIVYDPITIKSLCEVLKEFFERNPQLIAYIACVIRNEETYNEFLFGLHAINLRYKKLPYIEHTFNEWKYNNAEKCIIEIDC